ncbi:hypothetical protein [Streptomyces cellostaticus]
MFVLNHGREPVTVEVPGTHQDFFRRRGAGRSRRRRGPRPQHGAW